MTLVRRGFRCFVRLIFVFVTSKSGVFRDTPKQVVVSTKITVMKRRNETTTEATAPFIAVC